MPGTVEGQDIALAILGGQPVPGWEAFRERYHAQLIRQAEGLLRRMPTLRSFGQAEDLVQGFLTERVMSHAPAMLGPTARGEKPLWPRLSRSFSNYGMQMLRRLARHPRLVGENAAELEAVTDVGDEQNQDDIWTSITQRIRERHDAIRSAFEQDPGMVPLLHLLLLSERLFLAQLVETTFAEADPSPSLQIPIPELVNRIAPWSDQERGQILPPRDIRLGEIWNTLTRSALRTDGDAIAQVLGVRRNTWDQRIHRARLRVLNHVGLEDCRRLFPHWPERLTGKAVRSLGKPGGS